jgi:hypothetical protein
MAPEWGTEAVATEENKGAARAEPKAQDRHQAHSQLGDGAQQREGDDGGGTQYPADQDDKAQEGEPVRRAVEQDEAPDRRGQQCGSEAIRPTHVARRCHSAMVPMPTSPPSGAARATV